MIFDKGISDERFSRMSFEQREDYLAKMRRDLDILERVKALDYSLTDEELIECLGEEYINLIDNKIREENERKNEIQNTTPKTLDYRDYLT